MLMLLLLAGLLHQPTSARLPTPPPTDHTAETSPSSPSSSPPNPSPKCKNVNFAIEALQLAWDNEYGYTRPCGASTNTCSQGDKNILATWVSTFTAAANARFNATRATIEFNNLMKGQWSNGFLPHAMFLNTTTNSLDDTIEHAHKQSHRLHNQSNHSHPHPPHDQPIGVWSGLTPGPEWWDISITNQYDAHIRTSGVAAPPTQATVALQIYLYLWHEHPTGTTAHEFLYQAYVNIYNWHNFLHTQRDPDGNGLVYIRHPWESPLSWNASSVAAALERANITDHRTNHGQNSTLFPPALDEVSGFPGNKTYTKMLKIAACQQYLQWDEALISKISLDDRSSPCGFLVEDIAFNSLLLRSNHDLYAISTLLLQDKQGSPSDDDRVLNMQEQITTWISVMENALRNATIVRPLPTNEVAAGAVMISTDLSHRNQSANDHFDVGALFPLLTADRISTRLATELSTSALSPLFWTRYPLSESSLMNSNQGSQGSGGSTCHGAASHCNVDHHDDHLDSHPTVLDETPIAIHVVGLLVEAWSMDVTGEQGLTLRVLARYMSSQARTLFPMCTTPPTALTAPTAPRSKAHTNPVFYDRYGSDTGTPLPCVAEFGSVVSSPRAAAVAILLHNLTLPNTPPIPPIGLGWTVVIMWSELIFAFTVGISCIILAVYHIRLISHQDQEESDARANAYRHREESSYRESDSDYMETGDDSDRDDDRDDAYNSTKEFKEQHWRDDEGKDEEYGGGGGRSRQKTNSSNGLGGGGGEWSWPLSYLFGGGEESRGSGSTSSSPRYSPRYSRAGTPSTLDLSTRGERETEDQANRRNNREPLLDNHGSDSDASFGETDFDN